MACPSGAAISEAGVQWGARNTVARHLTCVVLQGLVPSFPHSCRQGPRRTQKTNLLLASICSSQCYSEAGPHSPEHLSGEVASQGTWPPTALHDQPPVRPDQPFSCDRVSPSQRHSLQDGIQWHIQEEHPAERDHSSHVCSCLNLARL